MEIRYLEQEEKERSRKLWEQCFAEDSSRFLDYYYGEKCRDNQILVLEDGDEICAMLQRNPYQIYYGGKRYQLDYIVGVATAPECRHRGYMRRLLIQMLEDQEREKMPFTFLMPADPAIYQPFGFVYVYDQPFWRLNEAGERLRRVRIGGQGEEQAAGKAVDEKLELAGRWLNQWLARRYQIFSKRDDGYMLRLWKEIVSEYGQWDLLYEGERLVGMECFWGKEEKERRFLYAEEAFTESDKKARPAIMARIVNLEEFFKGIRLKPDAASICITLGIQDRQIERNCGLFSWRITKEGSQLQKLGDDIPDGTLSVTVEALTQWLMGYGKPEGIPELLLKTVQTEQRIFLDEVV
ncbi:MAG: GNAT family N-acetyltransferase [Lachnospiraceae bacterium]|nr:GNAT family N-acetyltransferase [Lachnospiraceae bacterium]MDO5551410.1 GNAT family N-acetyltransferase [Lachnospiraceae bacterium]